MNQMKKWRIKLTSKQKKKCLKKIAISKAVRKKLKKAQMNKTHVLAFTIN